ncbi:MAG TPA: Lrp/AsnC family transcriptional regulator [Pseudonocardia sp.]|jgi:DNA-binding Lrp family transcriptional regulator
MQLDELDLALLNTMRTQPKAGALELSRLLRVARATVTARLQRLETAGVITGYGPDVDLAAAGYPVQAFVTLEIAQGALEQIAHDLAAIPGVIEAYATTGTGDVLCRIAASSHQDLQSTLLLLNHSTAIDRSTSVIALTTVVEHRVAPLLARDAPTRPSRSPAFRSGSADHQGR